MNKYKIGDEVKIKSKEELEAMYGYINIEVKNFTNVTTKIAEVGDPMLTGTPKVWGPPYKLSIDNGVFWWYAQDFQDEQPKEDLTEETVELIKEVERELFDARLLRQEVTIKELEIRGFKSGDSVKYNERWYICLNPNYAVLYNEDKPDINFPPKLIRLKDKDIKIDEIIPVEYIGKGDISALFIANRMFNRMGESLVKVNHTTIVDIYEVVHATGGKVYKFLKDEESERMDAGDVVICDTKYGHTFGVIKGITTTHMNFEKLKEYKTCKKYIQDKDYFSL